MNYEKDLSKFHDAILQNIKLEMNHASLGFNLYDGSFVELLMFGLDRFLCNELREGNVILEVAIVSDDRKYFSILERIFNLHEKKSPKENELLNFKIGQLKNNNLILLHLSPSYGCELFALCESIKIREIKTQPKGKIFE